MNVTEKVRSLRQSVTNHTDSTVATYLIVAGVLLFVIPEPITSAIGFVVLLFGLVAWLAGKLV